MFAERRLERFRLFFDLDRADLMTVGEAADHLRLGARTTKRLAGKGELPSLQIQGTVFFLRRTVEEYERWKKGQGPPPDPVPLPRTH